MKRKSKPSNFQARYVAKVIQSNPIEGMELLSLNSGMPTHKGVITK